MTEPSRPWRGVSAEDRRAERNQRLREACRNIVGAGGVAGVTVDLVCAEAKLTKRYFYENFTDLDALLGAIVDDLFTRLQMRMEAALTGELTGLARSHAVVKVLIDVLSEDARLARLYVESTGHPLLREKRDQAITLFSDFVLAKVSPEAAPASLTVQRRLATWLLVAGTTDLVTSWLAGKVEADRATLIETIVGMGRPV